MIKKIENKICNKCEIFKNISEFRLYRSICILCERENNKIYRKKNKQKERDRLKIYRKVNKNKRLNYEASYRENNKEKISKTQKEYYLNNKEKVQNRQNNYEKERLNNDPLFRLTKNIRSNIRQSIIRKGYNKKSKTCDILGCTYNEFKTHIESQFESWMTWENYGNPKDGVLELNKTWDIDHIIPLCSATCESEIYKLNHFNNLQPLCSYNNRNIKRDN